jgi:hypothetical protein
LVGDDHASAPADRVAVLGARLPELEGDLHLLGALGIGVPGRFGEEGDEERESHDHISKTSVSPPRRQKA